ncbi:TPA: hypothetical protein V0N84_000798 [Streptococcus pneumoniae]|nr:hypothetical protein [Streptococcus pneumoniae]
MTSNKAELERKFAAKERKRNKPGVVLCGSLEKQVNNWLPSFGKKVKWSTPHLLQ